VRGPRTNAATQGHAFDGSAGAQSIRLLVEVEQELGT
jgi:hypothetical protein